MFIYYSCQMHNNTDIASHQVNLSPLRTMASALDYIAPLEGKKTNIQPYRQLGLIPEVLTTVVE